MMRRQRFLPAGSQPHCVLPTDGFLSIRHRLRPVLSTYSTENVCLNGQFTRRHPVRRGKLGVLLNRQPGGSSCNERSDDTGEVERLVATQGKSRSYDRQQLTKKKRITPRCSTDLVFPGVGRVPCALFFCSLFE